MADIRKHRTSNLIRFTLKNSSTGVGLTGLSSASSGLIISTICDNEATATVYTVAAGNVETITTLGTYAAPTASKCRFKEVDATNHKGLYEFQFADARFSVASAKRLIISVTGATSLLDADYEVQFDGREAGVVSDAGNTATTFKTDLTESGTDYWKDCFITFITGTLAGQTKKVSAYNGTTNFVTVSAFTAAPAAGARFIIINK